VFETLSDRLDKVFAGLRGKGRLSDADIDATAREIRIALLEADVALPVVRQFISAIKERAQGSEVSQALNPAQQVIKIVNEELIAILGGETRRLRFAKQSPTVIMLAGLQGSGKTTLAGKLGRWLKSQGHTPLLVAADLQRPNAVNQLSIVAQQAGVDVFAPEPGNGIGDPIRVAADSLDHARRTMHDVVVVDTAGRLGIDAELMAQAASIRDVVRPDETLFVVDAMIGPAADSPSAFLRTAMLRLRFASSTKLSGHTCSKNSALSTRCPCRSTRSRRMSKTFGVSGTGWPSRSRRCSLGSRRNGPNA
jgi:signal recognition particle subunit SRP54